MDRRIAVIGDSLIAGLDIDRLQKLLEEDRSRDMCRDNTVLMLQAPELMEDFFRDESYLLRTQKPKNGKCPPYQAWSPGQYAPMKRGRKK